MGYAQGTGVSVDQSKGELKRVIYKYGASNYKYGEEDDRAMVMFSKNDRIVRFVITFPPPDSKQFTHTAGRHTERTQAAAYKEYEAEQRRRWRALILAIKAKFEVVESGIASFEEEFLSYILLPNSLTVGQVALPGIDEAYRKGKGKLDIKLIPDVSYE